MFGGRPSVAWTPQQDQILMDARARGMNWPPIQQQNFPTKTPNACRKRHERLMERRNNEDWAIEKWEMVAGLYMDQRKDIWSPLAASVGEKWQVVEAKILEKGLKNTQSAARSGRRRERLAAGYDDGDDISSNDAGTSDAPVTPEASDDDASSNANVRMTPEDQHIRSNL
ncbi:MAG: GTPase-activating protein S23 [Chaenotheca gracillima]|nr:MAG: GTPase-activating protein S23 [Chaenotheca gracillima]